MVQVKGEISNLAKPASRHLYFSLKDDKAQIKCAFFRGQQTPRNSNLVNGQSVILQGTITLYEARGDYQLVVTNVIPDGEGLLLQQIEQLKQTLNQEGLFTPDNKLPIPRLPQTIGIITSHSGAALHDILSTLQKRYPIASIQVYGCEVQGANAAQSIIRALAYAISSGKADVLIIARGGGSVEDLMPFNDESLARAIAACPIPTICGVGHETDFTICDLVADKRAPTPTGAAQASCLDQTSILQQLTYWQDSMRSLLMRRILNHTQQFKWLLKQFLSPTKLLFNKKWQTLDYLQIHLCQGIQSLLNQNKQHLNQTNSQLYQHHPRTVIENYQHQFQFMLHRLNQAMQQCIHEKKQPLKNGLISLHALSPLATLTRGYAITTHQGNVVTDPMQVEIGNNINIRVKYGSLTCQVMDREKINDNQG